MRSEFQRALDRISALASPTCEDVRRAILHLKELAPPSDPDDPDWDEDWNGEFHLFLLEFGALCDHAQWTRAAEVNQAFDGTVLIFVDADNVLELSGEGPFETFIIRNLAELEEEYFGKDAA